VQPPLDAVRDLEAALQQLMRLLDAREPDPRALEQAASACDQGFEALRAGYEHPARSADVELAQVLRSNAVALDLAGRRLGGVGERLEQVRAARQALRRASSSGADAGASCDVAG
jgi:hypothetical protein